MSTVIREHFAKTRKPIQLSITKKKGEVLITIEDVQNRNTLGYYMKRGREIELTGFTNSGIAEQAINKFHSSRNPSNSVKFVSPREIEPYLLSTYLN